MDVKVLEWVRLKTVIILFENNGLESQIEGVKLLIKKFVEEFQLDQNEIVLGRIHPDANILKSKSVIEKGFPLAYFIQARQFFGIYNLSADTKLLNKVVKPEDEVECINCLNQYFRGCEILPSSSILEMLRTLRHLQKDASAEELLQPTYPSQLMDNAIWTVKWGINTVWNYASQLASYWWSPPSLLDNLQNTSKPSSLTLPSSNPFIEVPAIKFNWYGRSQRRIYRFYNEYFERLDPFSGVDGAPLLRETFKYTDVEKLVTENGSLLIIYFVSSSSSTVQWLQSPFVNAMIQLICVRSDKNIISVVRNLEIKMNRYSVSTAMVEVSNSIVGAPRWAKDELSIAYQDSVGWKSLDLERIDITSTQWNAYDPVHFPENFVKSVVSSPVGLIKIDQSKPLQFISQEELTNDYRDCNCMSENLFDQEQGEVRHSIRVAGLIADLIQRTSNQVDLYITTADDFHGVWKLKHRKLSLYGFRCSYPSIAGNGKYIAFWGWKVPESNSSEEKTEERPSPAYLIIHKIAPLKIPFPNSNQTLDLEKVEFEGRKYSRLYPQLNKDATLPSLYAYYQENKKQ